jgi:DNA-binding ferritin-like protein
MKTFYKFLNSDVKVKGSSKDQLQELLSIMHTTYWNYHTVHWQAKGSYGRHLLFQRLYESMRDEKDELAEKLVGYFGEETVDFEKIISKSLETYKKFESISDSIERCIKIEEYLQSYLKEIYENLKSNEDLTLGLDDYLMSLANKHETNLYLLSQNKS